MGCFNSDVSNLDDPIEDINIKATSNVGGNSSGYSIFGGQIDAFVVGASGYGQGANLNISAVNYAGPDSAANVHIGNLNVTASAEAGFSGFKPQQV